MRRERLAPAPPTAASRDRSWQPHLPTDGVESLLLSVAAIVVAALLFGGFLALQGHDPLAVYQTLYLGAFGTRFSVENTLTQAAPLLLTALCTLIPARVGLLVIGAEGAVVMGGLGAVLAGVALGGRSGTPRHDADDLCRRALRAAYGLLPQARSSTCAASTRPSPRCCLTTSPLRSSTISSAVRSATSRRRSRRRAGQFRTAS